MVRPASSTIWVFGDKLLQSLTRSISIEGTLSTLACFILATHFICKNLLLTTITRASSIITLLGCGGTVMGWRVTGNLGLLDVEIDHEVINGI